MDITEEAFMDILDEVVEETLDLKKGEKARFANALVERLKEEDLFSYDDEEEYEDLPDDEDDV